jgi:hypothetical protein
VLIIHNFKKLSLTLEELIYMVDYHKACVNLRTNIILFIKNYQEHKSNKN